MSQTEKNEWSRIRTQGKAKYIVIHWVISTAIPVSIVLTIVRGFTLNKGFHYFLTLSFTRNIFLSLLICEAISIILGILKWNKNEKEFLK